MTQETDTGVSEESVFLEFYDRDDGSDQFTVEISMSDFERYQLISENSGIPLEELVLKMVRAEFDEQNTQWLIPRVDSDGNITLDGATHIELPDPSEMVPNEEDE